MLLVLWVLDSSLRDGSCYINKACTVLKLALIQDPGFAVISPVCKRKAEPDQRASSSFKAKACRSGWGNNTQQLVFLEVSRSCSPPPKTAISNKSKAMLETNCFEPLEQKMDHIQIDQENQGSVCGSVVFVHLSLLLHLPCRTYGPASAFVGTGACTAQVNKLSWTLDENRETRLLRTSELEEHDCTQRSVFGFISLELRPTMQNPVTQRTGKQRISYVLKGCKCLLSPEDSGCKGWVSD